MWGGFLRGETACGENYEGRAMGGRTACMIGCGRIVVEGLCGLTYVGDM